MSKRSRSRSPRHSSRRHQHQRQHLYVLLEDWERGCSIYRVSEDDLEPDSDADIETAPIARIEAHHPLSWSFASHGTNILAVRQDEGSLAIPGFDTETMGVTLCPLPRSHRRISTQNPRPLYVPLGDDRLFVMVGDSVELLGPRPPPDSAEQAWSWSSINTRAPFSPEQVTGYALHPDGRTVFVSVTGATYSFDAKRLEFQHHGEWTLPFRGRAHYDGELDAWVGLPVSAREGSGRVCSCDVPSSRTRCETMPEWKMSEDEVFDCWWRRHRGATLVYMGSGSRYCVVRCCAHRDDEKVAYPSHRVMQMIRFDLKYDKNGELRITARRGRASISYKVAGEFRAGPTLDPTAFWM